MKKKLIGFVTGWACKDWIKPALDQATEYCDEVLVCIAPHSESMVKFEDESYEIANEYKGIKLVPHNELTFHADAKAKILNRMIETSELFDVGNWIWILDVDEFYSYKSYRNIRKIIHSADCDQLRVQEMFFMINMRHYLDGEHNRLFCINNKDNRFYPTQRWSGASKVGIIPKDLVCMFHYGMLTDSNAKMEFWKGEYAGTDQIKKTTWLDNIYRNYDLEDEGKWIEENYKLTGVYSPWFAKDFTPDKNNFSKLFRYKGKHPKFIQKTNLLKIDDFRDYYGFRKSQ